MVQNKALNLLGLCQRAGRLTSGEPQVLDAIRKKKATYVLLAKDAGESTVKKIKDKCQYYQIPIATALTSDELTQALGKPRVVVAIMDSGFTKKLKQYIEEGD